MNAVKPENGHSRYFGKAEYTSVLRVPDTLPRWQIVMRPSVGITNKYGKVTNEITVAPADAPKKPKG